MMERKWGAIGSGATFEALATTLIFFEDPGAALFGRRGTDGGQDARSGDRKTVYQAKHHASASASLVIADAKREAKKVFACRQPGHERFEQWKDVTSWRLVTNADFNPRDEQTWTEEIRPLFAAMGLVADFWERRHLDSLLTKHPEVSRAFFGNEPRALLSLPEMRERRLENEPFLQRAALGRCVGREQEVEAVRAFLDSPERFLLVCGAGGVGKTRFVFEAGERIASEGQWQVLGALVASMGTGGRWFDGVVAERPTLLLLDDPQDEVLLTQLQEQLGGRVGRMSAWKVAVAVRSPNVAVVRFLRSARVRTHVRELELGPLPAGDAEAMCEELLSTGPLSDVPGDRRRDVARVLAKRFRRHPVWMTLAVHELESRGDLSIVPMTAHELAESYIAEIVRRQEDLPRERILSLLRWVALLGTVNREDRATIQAIANGVGADDLTQVRVELESLVKRGALSARGANRRLVEFKPDTLRDHVLLNWLSAEVGSEENARTSSTDADFLVVTLSDAARRGEMSKSDLAVLSSLGRTEALLRFAGHKVSLLERFFAELIRAVDTMSARLRIELAKAIVDVAPFRPVDATRLISAMRRSISENDEIELMFGRDRLHVVAHDDVVLDLAWPLSHAALGATAEVERGAVLEELCALVVAEAEVGSRRAGGLPNDGRRAAALLEKILEGAPHIPDGFETTALGHARELVARLAHAAPTVGDEALRGALIDTIVSAERTQTWSDEETIHMRTVQLGASHPAWISRGALLDEIRVFVANRANPFESRIALWKSVVHAHRSLLHCRGSDADGPRDHVRDALRSDLLWMREVLDPHEFELAELRLAREIWHWHLEFDEEQAVKTICEALELQFHQNALIGEFEPFLGRVDWTNRHARIVQRADALSHEDEDAIAEFLGRVRLFVAGDEKKYPTSSLAWELGRRGPESQSVRSFVRRALGRGPSSPEYEFALNSVEAWVGSLRADVDGDAPVALVAELTALLSNSSEEIVLVERIYGGYPVPSANGRLTSAEHAFLRSLAPKFAAAGRVPSFLHIIGCTLGYDWTEYQRVVDAVLLETPVEQLTDAVRGLVGSVVWALSAQDAIEPPDGFSTWLFARIAQAPDMDRAVGESLWQVHRVFERGGRVPIQHLHRALRDREARELESERHSFEAVGRHVKLSRFAKSMKAIDVGDSEVAEAVRGIVDIVGSRTSLLFATPKILKDIDPEGLLVPAEITARIRVASASRPIRDFARVASAYGVGSTAWRTIARAILLHPTVHDLDTRDSYFVDLTNGGMSSWSGTYGQVPPVFIEAVASAKAARGAETDEVFAPFWTWQLERAENDLRHHEGRAKEERGE